jgi:hypothetical protein
MRKQMSIILTLCLSVATTTFAPELDSEIADARLAEYFAKVEYERNANARIDRLLKTIRIIESNENYTIYGSSGEYGAYQFVRKYWNNWCMQLVGYPLDIKVPENQDTIAMLKIKKLIDSDYTNEQIASIWNSGSPEWEGKKGVNRKYGVVYNVPRYVERFMAIYTELEMLEKSNNYIVWN